MRRVKTKNIVFAGIWALGFTGAALYIATGNLAGYSGRRGRGIAEFLESIRASIGDVALFAIITGIGLAVAAWVLFSKDDEDDDRQPGDQRAAG